MTYENEMNTNRRSNISDDIKFTHWIIVGAVALAIVIAARPSQVRGTTRTCP